jgi:Ca-activated chloride channel family protein
VRRAAPLALALSLALAAGAALLARAAEPAPIAPPRFTVRITEPAQGDFVFGKVKIVAEVKSKDEIKDLRVEFSIGGKLVFIDREAPFECYHDFGDQPKSWVIEAKAVGPDGISIADTIVTRKLEINYREEVDRVVVAATVMDGNNTFVPGLKKSDFTLTEDDVPQDILEFGAETRPITLGVLIDTSGSMKERIGATQVAAKDFVNTIRPEDRAFIVDLDENVFLLQDLTSDHALLKTAIEGTDADGGTAIYDAIYVSFYKMKRIEGRKAIALLTDGEDTSSKFSFKKVTELTRTNDIIMYPIGLGASIMDVAIRGTLKQLADDTGGRAFFPKNANDLKGVYDAIATDLRSQYYITYSPKNRALDGSWRAIKLVCANPDIHVKTRRGYYAVKH